MTEKLYQALTHDLQEEEYDEGISFPEFLAQEEAQRKKLPSPDKVFLTVPEAAALLDISPYQLRTAVHKGHIRSKRFTRSSRARFMIHRDWLEEYQRYSQSPTIGMRIKAWFRRQF